jgi:hypothetical protein
MRNPITRKPLLAWEITLTLVIKFSLIYIIWLLFFSHPVEKSLDIRQVGNAIFGDHATAIAPSNAHKKSMERN